MALAMPLLRATHSTVAGLLRSELLPQPVNLTKKFRLARDVREIKVCVCVLASLSGSDTVNGNTQKIWTMNWWSEIWMMI